MAGDCQRHHIRSDCFWLSSAQNITAIRRYHDLKAASAEALCEINNWWYVKPFADGALPV
jgi:hypothetical protein